MKVDEWHMYGSARLGVYEASRTIGKRVARDLNNDNQITNNEYVIETPEELMYLYSSYQLERGVKRYELVNHLGNVLTVISDKKTANFTGTTFTHFTAERISATDYSPFGAPLAGRTWNGGDYRFGFNTQERDDEIAGVGNIMTAQFWEYDARLGRRWNVDPKPNPSLSFYVCFGNNPVLFNEINGDTLFSKGNNAQNLLDIKGMVGAALRGRITINTIPNRADGMGSFFSIDSRGYTPGTDAGMDLLIQLSNPHFDAIYSTEAQPLVDPAGPLRQGSQRIAPIRINYDYSSVIVNTIQPKEGLLGNQSSFFNGDYPPWKISTQNLPGRILQVPVTAQLQVALSPSRKSFLGTNGHSEIPRSMVAFQMLQAAFLLQTNTSSILYNFNQAVKDANRILGSSYYQGERNQRLPKQLPDTSKEPR